jgi:hypothetical protein
MTLLPVLSFKSRLPRPHPCLDTFGLPCRLPAPPSCPLAVVHGVAVPPALVGDVVQLLQFLATFAPLLALPCLAPSKLLQELLEADRLPRGDRSSLGQVSPAPGTGSRMQSSNTGGDANMRSRVRMLRHGRTGV